MRQGESERRGGTERLPESCGRSGLEPSNDEGRLIELLVDGELDESRRESLIRGMEGDPLAWKRCALAFLEAQTLAVALRETKRLARGIDGAPGGRASARRVSGSRRLGLAAAFAASLLLGFAAGNLVSKERAPGEDGGQWTGTAGSEGLRGSAPADGSDSSVEAPRRSGESSVTLVLADEQGVERQLEIPAVPLSGLGPMFRWAEESARTNRLVEELRKAGRDVRRERSWVPVELEDGRRALVPVDDVELASNGTVY